MTGICIPCYTILSTLIPGTKPLLDQCQANLERWQQIDDYEQDKLKHEAHKSEEEKSLTKLDDEKTTSKSNHDKCKDNQRDSKVTKTITVLSKEVPKGDSKVVTSPETQSRLRMIEK